MGHAPKKQVKRKTKKTENKKHKPKRKTKRQPIAPSIVINGYFIAFEPSVYAYIVAFFVALPMPPPKKSRYRVGYGGVSGGDIYDIPLRFF